ncbi:unnamed protein product [Schistocephalus solidus]|uniref:C2H2-type domain-containing protein n=1 Tax=Schistocephalus solidus TaxID=70667 RepID=A0A183TUK0_SCHSO|nr:unnamed protein product [Schistocephalus solidus]
MAWMLRIPVRSKKVIQLPGLVRVDGSGFRSVKECREPVPGAPTHSRDRRLHCLHCPRAFTHRMGLFGHLLIHDNGIYRNAENTATP